VNTYESVLDALGDRTRRQIVEQLRRGPASVGELAAGLPVLRRSGLVSYEERGTRNIYRLDPAGLGGLRAWLDGFWQAALVSYADAVRADRAGGTEQLEHQHREHRHA
jgi:DNA-binding transcriptional ArsR family regulator